MRNMRPRIKLQKKYTSSNKSCQFDWAGSATTVGGGYVSKYVYAFAAKHGVIAVGGDTR
jgi:hypothetical protein